jgi:hypothetical protein
MTPTWENPIKTYFTSGDVACMKKVQPQLDLADYTSTKDNAVLIYPMVSSKRMPPGRPWTDEQIANFKAWTEAGCPEK